mmetsp:Transcript_49081/g.91981  ORF Transcript_49081/g.91981 Transcript_49081/m.91981 type:complete len:174 (+) Transcript_49081:70-591(+)
MVHPFGFISFGAITTLAFCRKLDSPLSGCDVSLLQTGFNVEDAVSDKEPQSLRDEMSLLSDSLDHLTADMDRNRPMPGKQRPVQESIAAHLRELQAENQHLLGQLLSTNATATNQTSFDDWCKSNSDIVLGLATFLATCVLIALCLPCGLTPLQICLGFGQASSASGGYVEKL